ncbi:MAG: protein kinase, partial [Candidatus Sumerlaeota bacterium]|nr:protein kinase [Candidatus Sumerlaeota bacterium]
LVTSDGSLQAVDTRDRRARSVAIEIGGAVTRVPGLPPAPLLPDNISRRETQPHARGPAGPFGGNGRDLRPESTLVAPTPAGPASAWPALMAEAKALLDRGADDRPARERYASVLPVFNDYAASRPTDLEARLTLARLYLVCQRAEECCKTLADLCQGERDAWEPAFGIYAELLERFPRYQQARKERANLAERLGRLQTAIEDLEAIDTRDETKHSTAERLAELYRLRLEEAPEPQTQFKLVKLCLKLQRLDEAIAILKTLVDHPAYREQALRALGLCHWQKGEHPAAWLAFSRLPLDAGLAETLYRLACEMESADKLRQALEVFQHIEQGQRGYRDVPMRIKKLDYRVRLLRSQVDQTLPVERPLSEFDDSRFAVLEEINRGSMGVIYKAKDRILDEIVAIKILNDPLAADPVAVERFKQEARAAKRLSHPNIVRIHDMFETPKKKWLSMEYIDGDDVKRLLANHVGFSEERILQMLRQILEALDYAHGLGVVHRDIKPANIMIARNGQVKVADFGIAKILTNSDATKAGSIVVGTPLYMSPEQIEGGPVDARADLYSLGITTYELLSGAPPFTSGNLEYQHLYSAVVPLPPTVSAVLREFVGRSIAKDPVDRFQNARQAVEFLFGKM